MKQARTIDILAMMNLDEESFRPDEVVEAFNKIERYVKAHDFSLMDEFLNKDPFNLLLIDKMMNNRFGETHDFITMPLTEREHDILNAHPGISEMVIKLVDDFWLNESGWTF